MTKTWAYILIASVLALFIVAAGLYTAFFTKRDDNSPAANSLIRSLSNLPAIQDPRRTDVSGLPAPNPGIPQEDTFVLATPSGGVTVNNVYKRQVDSDEGMVIFESRDEYQMGYYPEDGSFGINISKEPVRDNLRAAEALFLQSLGVNKEDACRLKVYVTIQPSVSGGSVATVMPLSFCSGKVQ